LQGGDGFPKAAAPVTKKPQDQLVPDDFIKLTGIRQQHTLAAMTRIGLKAEDLLFLGYPDAGLGEVYAAEGSVPFRQRFTRKNETYGAVVPDYYTRVYGHPAPYTRASVVGDMTEIIKARQPKEIYVTNEVDGHAEHRVSFWVVRDAVQAAGWRGTISTYLVHGHTLPEGPERRLRLTAEELDKKRATIEEYAKHLSPIHDRLAEKFTKPEEVFWPIRIEGPLAVPPEGFTALFNGEDLAGWHGVTVGQKPVEGWEKYTEAEDGVFKLFGAPFKGTEVHPFTKRKFKDFVLMLDWRLVGGGPTGVYFDQRGGHVEMVPKRNPVSGGISNSRYRPADLPPIDWSSLDWLARTAKPFHTHMAYPPTADAAHDDGQWNRFVITKRGTRISVELNGITVIDNVLLAASLSETSIGFQNHGYGRDGVPVAEFRNIFIKELPPTNEE